MLSSVDKFLNSITMYKLVLYGLLVQALYAFLASVFGFLTLSAFSLICSFAILLSVTYSLNSFLGKTFNAPINPESAPITALILFFVLVPPTTLEEASVLVVGAVLAMLSKYLIAPMRRHIFNPAAFAAFVLGVANFGFATWWVATPIMFPATVILGFLVVRKIRRFSMFFAFLAIALLRSFMVGGFELLLQDLVSWPLIFLGTIMLTEPFTMPPKRGMQVIYGLGVGLLSVVPFTYGIIYGTPELSLLIGNIFSYIVSFRRRIMFSLESKREISKGTFEWNFLPGKAFAHIPGQYLEWTLAHDNSDSRGVRRYFTISSAPHEHSVKIGVRTAGDQSSSFKKALLAMPEGGHIVAGQLAGDFVLPKNPSEKLAFIAGGIGVTPFRSMISHLLFTKERRDIVFFYTVKAPDEIAYMDIWEQAEKELGIRVFFVITDPASVPQDWHGQSGFINEAMLAGTSPDFKDRKFYLSGPNAMVESYKKMLRKGGVSSRAIITDYFPGF